MYLPVAFDCFKVLRDFNHTIILMGKVRGDLTGQGWPDGTVTGQGAAFLCGVLDYWGPVGMKCSTYEMALKQRGRRAEMMTNDTKMDWKCDSNRVKCKYLIKYWQRHGFLLNMQNIYYSKRILSTLTLASVLATLWVFWGSAPQIQGPFNIWTCQTYSCIESQEQWP